MATGLRCLIEDAKVINRIKASFTNIANLMIANDPAIKVTAKTIYSQLKSAGVDIDLESVAAIYSDAFASSIGIHSNFESDAELLEYKTKTQPLNPLAKAALIKAGFGKTQKNGKQILDWVKLMRKSEDDLKDEVAQAIADSFPQGTDDAIIVQEVDNVMESLKGSWKQILSNAVIKGQNDLKHRNKPVDVNQKNAIDKISDLYAEGLFADFKEDYATAIRKAVGVSNENLTVMAELDALGKEAHLLATSKYGSENSLGAKLERRVNDVIGKARYKEAPAIFKIIQTVNSLFEFSLLRTLNNFYNRTQNYFSGKAGLVNTMVQYGAFPNILKQYGGAIKRDVIRNGGEDFGDINNQFTGNRSAVDRVRKRLVGEGTSPGQRTANTIFNFVMGISALNGVDNYNKVLNTWVRFASGMEEILISKGMNKKDAQKFIHEALYGENQWKDAITKATDVINSLNAKGGKFPTTQEAIIRFAGDIIKTEIVEKEILTPKQLNAAFNAAYSSAGVEMGHVPNNFISAALNNFKQKEAEKINKSVMAKDYKRAASLMINEILVTKVFGRFMSGGTNWIVLKAEKGGLGIVRAFKNKSKFSFSFEARKRLSDLSAKEVEEHLFNVQMTNDRFARGTVGLLSNAMVISAVLYVMNRGNDDEEKRRKKALVAWLKEHHSVSKAVDALVPWWASFYIAKMKQDNMGYEQLDNKYKNQPIVEYVLKFANQTLDYTFVNQLAKTLNITSDNEEKQFKSAEAAGTMLSGYFGVNPLPTQLVVDAMKIYKDINGTDKYVKPKYDSGGEAFGKGLLKYGVAEPFLK